MISVLIPVYNYKVQPLIEVIHAQLSQIIIDFEIICIDDASNKYLEENEVINKLQNTSFYNLNENIGRSKIRNLLVEKSKYDWLLFLDADVLPESENFIFNYIKCIQSNRASVYCGGIIYEKTKPVPEKLLRWIYGKKREEIVTSKRSINPYKNFFGANFLVNKSVFERCGFNVTIMKYGYEDVLFAEDLKTNIISVAHINNPVFHLGIENNSIFLEKTKKGVNNLFYLSSNNILIGDNLKLLKVFKKLKINKLNWLFAIGFQMFNKLLKLNLLSNNPSLFILDIYKLGYLCYIDVKADKKLI